LKALLLVNGELYQPAAILNRIRAEAFDLVIGVDGGAHHADTLGVTPDVIVGDLDSLSVVEQQNFNNTEIISYPVEKDETDLELALLYAKQQGAGQIVMAGVMGGRIDMTMANFMLLTHAGLCDCRIEVWHGEQTAWVIRPPGESISGHPGDTVSLIPLGGDASGITTEGMKYPLIGEKLSVGLARGISNVLEKPSARINLTEGILLAVHTPGNA